MTKIRVPRSSWDAPCAVCGSAKELIVNGGSFVLPKSRVSVLDRLSSWQDHGSRPNGGVRLGFPPRGVEGANENDVCVCKSCVSLLTRIDKLEADYLNALKQLWTLIDSYEEEEREEEPPSPPPPQCKEDVGEESFDLEPIVKIEVEADRAISPEDVVLPETSVPQIRKRRRHAEGYTKTNILLRRNLPLFLKKMCEVVGSENWFRPRECRVCRRNFRSTEAALEHFAQFATIHPGFAPFVCHFCLTGFDDLVEFASHVMFDDLERGANQEFECHSCSRSLPSPRLLDEHFRLEHDPERDGKPFACPECDGLPLGSLREFIEHRQRPLPRHARVASWPSEPGPRVEFRCHECGHENRDERELRNHSVDVHGTDKCHFCPRCRWPRKSYPVYVQHLILELSVKRLPTLRTVATRECRWCGNEFPSLDEVIGHTPNCLVRKAQIEADNDESAGRVSSGMEEDGLADDDEEPAWQVSVRVEEDVLADDEESAVLVSGAEGMEDNAPDGLACAESRDTEDEDLQESSASASTEGNSESSEEMPWVETRSARRRGRSSNVSTNGERQKCDLCGKMIANMKKHVDMVHLKVKDFACHLCDEKFVEKVRLTSHLCDAHGAPRPYKCRDCGRDFATKTARAVHRKSHDRVVCQVCGKSVSGGGGRLEEHIDAVHNRIARWTCGACGEKFLQKAKLARHEARVHGIKVHRFTFPCPTCGKVYSSAQLLRQHCVKKHGTKYDLRKMYPCRVCGVEFTGQQLIRHMQQTHGEHELEQEDGSGVSAELVEGSEAKDKNSLP